MSKRIKRVAVTGGAGQIAYNLLFRIGSGELFGTDQPIALHVLEVPQALQALDGVRMELEDCAFPLLREIRMGSDADEVFGDVDVALLVGAKPRGPGMERGELLVENGKIFIEQGRALNNSASRDVRVLVVGNPCNTNCWIAMTQAPDIPRRNFHAMTRLDQNRAKSQLANKSGAEVADVTCMTIWGNHSATQVPDYFNARIKGKPVTDVINEPSWLEGEFIETVQKRGAAVIAARGKSSAASAANAIIDEVHSWFRATPKGEWFSSCVISDNNPYGVDADLIFSFPCRSNGDGDWEIVKGLVVNESLKKKIAKTQSELKEERAVIQEMLKNVTV